MYIVQVIIAQYLDNYSKEKTNEEYETPSSPIDVDKLTCSQIEFLQQKSTFYIGERIKKKFDEEFYPGTVSGYNISNECWKIDYDDGDAEEFDGCDIPRGLLLFREQEENEKNNDTNNKKRDPYRIQIIIIIIGIGGDYQMMMIIIFHQLQILLVQQQQTTTVTTQIIMIR